MSARAEMVTKNGGIEVRLTPDHGSHVVFQLEVLEALALSHALFDYGHKVLRTHASQNLARVEAKLSDMKEIVG